MSARPTARPRWTLRQVAASLGVTPSVGDDDVVVTGIAVHTKDVESGDLYAALPGASAHGASFVRAALDAGAVAVLTDGAGAAILPEGVPALVVADPRSRLATLSAAFYGEPASSMLTVGVTGTQGKTTTTYLAEAALAGHRSAVIGTIGTRINGRPVASSLTTPEAPALQALFAVMREHDVEVCAMEVSSHALVQGRVDGVVFDIAVFLNLGRDHLDFHADLEDYFQAKALLFTPEHARRAVVNVDDEHGRKLLEQTTLPVTTVSSEGRPADWRAVNVRPHRLGTDLEVLGPGVDIELSVPLAGVFNVANALAVMAALAEAGHDPAELAAGIAASPGVPGRMERVEAGQDYTVIVDYAHKPDAVAAVLRALRPVTAGRLVLVLGAGGDRDRGKRPLMGRIAAELADVLIVTDDNPRTEDPALIRHELIAGAAAAEPPHAEVVEVDGRREAIAYAVELARLGDTIVVAGKGHERGQEIHGVVHPFDDREVLVDLIAGLRGAS